MRDDETWGTVTVEIPDETPEDKIEAVARGAVDSEGTTGVGTWLHHYSADDDDVEPGDDLCDHCMRSGVAIYATDEHGKTMCSVCARDHYADPEDPDDDTKETDDDRLDRFYAELERRQEDGEPLTCMSCNITIQKGESADPCFVCGQPLCYFCSISGPRCRGCADLP
jgi:hypothetical protein